MAPPNSVDPTSPLRKAGVVSRLCADLLPESIALSDAFGLTDWELGRYGLHKFVLSMFAIHKYNPFDLSVRLACTTDACMMHFGRGRKLRRSTGLPYLMATR